MAFNRVVVDFGQSIPSSHHYLVEFWVPQAADDALEKKKMHVDVLVKSQNQPWIILMLLLRDSGWL